eukprot:Hpha_TRINITY_DN27227_c0_g1::TRINITY_DN27227_c0_g1_i1::g.140809::m.140809
MGELMVFLQTGETRVPVSVPMMATVGELEEAAKKVLEREQVRLGKDGEAMTNPKAVLADLGVCAECVVEVLAGFRVTIEDEEDKRVYEVIFEGPPTVDALRTWVDIKWAEIQYDQAAVGLEDVSHVITCKSSGEYLPANPQSHHDLLVIPKPHKPLLEYDTEFVWRRLEAPKRAQVVYGRAYVPNENVLLLSNAATVGSRPGDGAVPNAPSAGAEDERHNVKAVEQWTAQAVDEAASVASFAALTLRLMANASPHVLLEESLRAGQEEIEHARLCRQLARKYQRRASGEEREVVEVLPPHNLSVQPGLGDLAERAVREGGIGETLAAASAALGASLGKDPEVKAVQSRIAADEARHAALAWATAAWACAKSEGGEARALIRGILEEEEAEAKLAGIPTPRLRAGGRRSRRG